VTAADLVRVLLGATTAAALAPVFGRLGAVAGLVDRGAGDLKIHREPVPILGGLVVVVAAGLAVVATGRSVPWALAGAVVVALLGGLVDDARPLPPWVRVLIVVLAGAVLATGFDRHPFVAGVGIVLLVLACANAVNIVDGQDGLAGGLAAMAAASLGVLGATRGDVAAVGIAATSVGALLGFLPWNWPRARLFLGNGGAYAVGAGLAFLAARVVAADGWRGLLAAGACLGVFAFEVAFTVARRATAGRAITAGDRLHSYDLLSRARGRAGSTTTFWALGLVAGAVGVGVGFLPLAAGAVLAAGVALAGTWWGFRLWARRTSVT
jgi:UDP-N-acetylmuramyl pentapeptide phosphotransferase/UDP-N-acetylglucosamine-1-phosphate transferase